MFTFNQILITTKSYLPSNLVMRFLYEPYNPRSCTKECSKRQSFEDLEFTNLFAVFHYAWKRLLPNSRLATSHWLHQQRRQMPLGLVHTLSFDTYESCHSPEWICEGFEVCSVNFMAKLHGMKLLAWRSQTNRIEQPLARIFSSFEIASHRLSWFTRQSAQK